MLYIIKNNSKIYNSLLDNIESKTINPFERDVIDFIDQFSIEIKKNKKTKDLKEFLSLAFWCRKKNFQVGSFPISFRKYRHVFNCSNQTWRYQRPSKKRI